PLLGVPKARLVAFLDTEGQRYVRDPSNRNPTFERARLRLAAAAAPDPDPLSASRGGEGPAPHAWECEPQVLQEIRARATTRIARERDLAVLLARTVSLHPAGFATLAPELIAAAGELGERALDRVIAVLGGVTYPVRRERLRRLREALAEGPSRPRTL